MLDAIYLLCYNEFKGEIERAFYVDTEILRFAQDDNALLKMTIAPNMGLKEMNWYIPEILRFAQDDKCPECGLEIIRHAHPSSAQGVT